MALLYGRAGRLTARNGGFRPGQARFSSYASSLAFANATYALEAELYPACRSSSTSRTSKVAPGESVIFLKVINANLH
jgi:hypothetical protein